MDQSQQSIPEKVKVYIRQRPSINNVEVVNSNITIESNGLVVYKHIDSNNNNNNENTIKSTSYLQNNNEIRFQFTGCYTSDITQEQIFNNIGKQMVDSCISGYSGSILAYGGTGSGKTYTIRGDNNENEGLMTRCLGYLLNQLQTNENEDIQIYLSYLQIYCENISDLLSEDKKDLSLRLNKSGSLYVEGLTKVRISSLDQFHLLLTNGDTNRFTASTNKNETSSRSHAICIITLIKKDEDSNKNSINTYNRESSLVFVDLAGSERASATKGKNYLRFEESKAINLSLSALGNCINALAEGKKHVPYRDSKLTYLLQSYLSGNSKLTIITTISSDGNSDDTLNSLRFAARASQITIKAIITRSVDYESLYIQSINIIDDLKSKVLSYENIISDHSNKITSQDDMIDKLNDKISVLQQQVDNYNIIPLTNNQIDSNNNSYITQLNEITNTFNNNLIDLKSKYDNKIKMLKDQINNKTKESNENYELLMIERKNHLNSLHNSRLLQEKIESIEKEFNERKEEILSDIIEKDNKIDSLEHDVQSANSSIVQLTNVLEKLEIELQESIPITKFKEMESLFLETTTNLSNRVLQLENVNNSRQITPTSSQNNNSQRANGSLNVTANRLTRIEPGGRIRR